MVTALSTRHAELARLIQHQQKEMGRLADDLAHRGHWRDKRRTLMISNPSHIRLRIGDTPRDLGT